MGSGDTLYSEPSFSASRIRAMSALIWSMDSCTSSNVPATVGRSRVCCKYAPFSTAGRISRMDGNSISSRALLMEFARKPSTGLTKIIWTHCLFIWYRYRPGRPSWYNWWKSSPFERMTSAAYVALEIPVQSSMRRGPCRPCKRALTSTRMGPRFVIMISVWHGPYRSPTASSTWNTYAASLSWTSPRGGSSSFWYTTMECGLHGTPFRLV
mmetsp:Transcript_19209/g.57456  ORF Transcript_19209/g.57456 Transcript_19209/m.57456 type:complete len:211 (-) Transcript_19209:266-898(-)